MNDIISIVTINYNNLNGLINTVNSVFNQSNNNFQYVIIDGNSTDGSKEFLQSLFHDNIKIISESDSGIYNAFNKGIQNSSGQYILFLNSGDVLYDSNSIA
ncbi:MAG: hypothetical protein RLY43_1069, partial [Bacteroidota bacterium]